MRNFVSDDGLFELTFPLDWKYHLSDGNHIHQFQFVEGIGSFHFSLRDDRAEQSFEEMSRRPEACEKRIGAVLAYEMLTKCDDEFNTLLWLIRIENYYFLASYTYSSLPKNSEQFSQELEIVYSIISSLKVIESNERLEKISWYKFGKFLYGLAASQELLSRASDKGCFVECVCLLANQIDAMLRTSNILFEQIENRSLEINLNLIHQSGSDKIITEKKIYQISRDREIIDQDTFDNLNAIYGERNKVIHRYIISEITTKDVLEIGIKYFELREIIYKAVDRLEEKQIALGLGMTSDKLGFDREEVARLHQIFTAEIKEKHGGMDFSEDN